MTRWELLATFPILFYYLIYHKINYKTNYNYIRTVQGTELLTLNSSDLCRDSPTRSEPRGRTILFSWSESSRLLMPHSLFIPSASSTRPPIALTTRPAILCASSTEAAPPCCPLVCTATTAALSSRRFRAGSRSRSTRTARKATSRPGGTALR